LDVGLFPPPAQTEAFAVLVPLNQVSPPLVAVEKLLLFTPAAPTEKLIVEPGVTEILFFQHKAPPPPPAPPLVV
jgi:hypothetical protein